jgi:protein-disulfide isomerase
MSSSTRLLLLSASVLAAACESKAPAPSSTVSPATGIAATVEGTTITLAEVDERAKDRLLRVRQQEYEARKQVLDELVAEKLVEKEAKGRGLSVEQLLRDEVDRQLPEVDAKQVALIYEKNRQAFGNRPRSEAETEIAQIVRERSRTSYRQAFAERLRQRAQVAVNLEPPRSQVIVPASEPTLGPDEARVKIVAFADYQCPYCQRAQGVIDQVLKTYAGRVQLVHRDFPLDGHGQAFMAARAARCAGEQGKFWDYHRSLMLEGGDMTDPDLQKRAKGLKLDVGSWSACVGSDRHDAAIRAGLEAGQKLGVNSTPSFFVNGQMLVGARPFEDFQEVIDAELRRAS